MLTPSRTFLLKTGHAGAAQCPLDSPHSRWLLLLLSVSLKTQQKEKSRKAESSGLNEGTIDFDVVRGRVAVS